MAYTTGEKREEERKKGRRGEQAEAKERWTRLDSGQEGGQGWQGGQAANRGRKTTKKDDGIDFLKPSLNASAKVPLSCAQVHIPTCARTKVPSGRPCAAHSTTKGEKPGGEKGKKKKEGGKERKGS